MPIFFALLMNSARLAGNCFRSLAPACVNLTNLMKYGIREDNAKCFMNPSLYSKNFESLLKYKSHHKASAIVPDKIRVAIVGVGNAASALVQGIRYYSEGDKPGLWHSSVGGHTISDIELVGAYDIDPKKVGLDVSQAIFEKPNVTPKYVDVKPLGIHVEAGLLGDEVPSSFNRSIRPIIRMEPVVDSLEEKKPDMILNLISSGSDSASRKYAEAALSAGCSFVNATPSPIASDKELATRYSRSGVILVGDDLMSQFGGTVFHKGILDFMVSRGIKIKKSYQLDVGGGSETLNTLSEDLRAVKRRLKTESIAVEVPYHIESVAGTTDYVDFMRNSRTSYFWIEGEHFLGSSVKFDIYLRTEDGPNGAGILVDLIRSVKAAKDRGEKGAEDVISAYGFKSPPKPSRLADAYETFSREYINR